MLYNVKHFWKIAKPRRNSQHYVFCQRNTFFKYGIHVETVLGLNFVMF